MVDQDLQIIINIPKALVYLTILHSSRFTGCWFSSTFDSVVKRKKIPDPTESFGLKGILKIILMSFSSSKSCLLPLHLLLYQADLQNQTQHGNLGL